MMKSNYISGLLNNIKTDEQRQTINVSIFVSPGFMGEDKKFVKQGVPFYVNLAIPMGEKQRDGHSAMLDVLGQIPLKTVEDQKGRPMDVPADGDDGRQGRVRLWVTGDTSLHLGNIHKKTNSEGYNVNFYGRLGPWCKLHLSRPERGNHVSGSMTDPGFEDGGEI